MILDSGIAYFYELVNAAEPGDMPVMVPAPEPYFRSYFAELDFETTQARPTPNREEVKTDARIRVLQNRAIKNTHAVYLATGSTVTRYAVTRAYHGADDETGELITDLNLEVVTP